MIVVVVRRSDGRFHVEYSAFRRPCVSLRALFRNCSIPSALSSKVNRCSFTKDLPKWFSSVFGMKYIQLFLRRFFRSYLFFCSYSNYSNYFLPYYERAAMPGCFLFLLEFIAILLRRCVIFYLLRVGRCLPDNRVFAQIYRSRFETTGTHQLCVCVRVSDMRFARFI